MNLVILMFMIKEKRKGFKNTTSFRHDIQKIIKPGYRNCLEMIL